MSEEKDNNFFKSFSSFARDAVIALIIAAMCWVSSSIIGINNSHTQLIGHVDTIESTLGGRINTINAQHEEEIANNTRRLGDLDKRFDQLNSDINRKLDRLNDKIDNLLSKTKTP